ncbi:ATP-dependent DNA helicase RecG [Cryobacterium frigoriphilum]|uniref:Probable DNA 3'-5' helicase RecG n=1 Tax=Cryobacterium frigoriphilum TaxID=1259150 RepID=A0A4R9AC56_9MICO|nr:ATP-dependent DNA helicase RecG [Cryobacterium frigoriphilum]TFD55271.1 ATP-dependent DNA helicase RecG [Cryobacterium frigoriphilum]
MTGLQPTAVPSDAKTLDSSLGPVVGGDTAKELATAFGMHTIADLLGHYPRRYALRGESSDLTRLIVGEDVTVIAQVVSVTESEMKSRPGTMVTVKITDGKDTLSLIFFGKGKNGTKGSQNWRTKALHPGVRGIFAGKVTAHGNTVQLAHPAYKTFDTELDEVVIDPKVKRMLLDIVPIYPATARITSWEIADAVALALNALGPIPDPVPELLRASEKLMPQGRALELIHRPHASTDWQQARDTLRFIEAWVLQCTLVQQHTQARERHTTAREPVPGGFLDRFDANLPFVLTTDQQIAAAEIAVDLSQTSPMSRLVQGEVGSGKTVVALRAMLAVADSGGQAALLAPTEVLAGQHLRSITAMLGPDLTAELMPTLLTGQLPAAEKRKALLRIVSGQSHIVIGTHTLMSDNVEFFDLGLVVIDEQHRFGVNQREVLRRKGATPPHTLVLTATPIPRTIAMTVFGDLDVSTIAMLPAGRRPIESVVVSLGEKPHWFLRIWDRVAEEVALGRQVFVVCPAIAPKLAEEGQTLDQADGTVTDAAAPARAAASAPRTAPRPGQLASQGTGQPAAEKRPIHDVETLLERLRQHQPLAGLRLEPLHGRMTSEEKDLTMRAFAAGEIDVLVATTVIEVGVDVPNASAMVVMDADRFGVSQLHQLRGRVGRGGVPGLCLLATYAKSGSTSRQRIDAVAATLDGFRLAELDLELRQEGNVLGDSQSGDRSSLRLLRVAIDGDLIARARQAAQFLISGDPALRTEPVLRQAVERRLNDNQRSWLHKG